MFSVLCINERQKGLRKRQEKIEAIQTPVKGGAPFRIINVTPGKKGINWYRIACQAGCASRNMIFPDGFEFQGNDYISRYVPDTLPLLILLNTAAAKLGKDTAAKRKILVVDKKGVLANYTDRIILCASKIKIVTDNPERYYKPSLDLMEHYGASPIICQSFNDREIFDAAVSLTPTHNAEINFSVDLFSQHLPERAQKYANLCPDSIDFFTFLCALFECSAVKEIGTFTLDSLL